MTIDWASIGIASAITLGAGVVLVAVVAAAVLAFGVAADRTQAGRPATVQRGAGYACLAVAAGAVLFGIYLIIPALH